MGAQLDRPPMATPDPDRVVRYEDLIDELDLLRRRAAMGSRKARVSLDVLAKRTGVPRSTIHVYVSGRSVPPPDVLDAIVTSLGEDRAARGRWLAALERTVSAESDHGPAEDGGDDRGAVQPQQLPLGVHHFVGRGADLKAIDYGVDHVDGRPRIVTIVGVGGVGKSALAIHWAALHQAEYPGGTLYVDLGGYAHQEPLEPARVLSRLLVALGYPPSGIPGDLDSLGDRFRSVTAGRDLLIVFDNARDAEHVRPLLPGVDGGTVLITSRDGLVPLTVTEGATRVELSPLDRASSAELLQRFEPSEQLEVVLDRCAGLPLALRIVRERLEATGSVDGLVEDLSGPGSVLDALQLDQRRGSGVRGVLSWSFRHLAPELQRLFRQLAAIPGPRVSLAEATAVAGEPRPLVRRGLERLSQTSLLTNTEPELWHRHDLVTALGVELLEEDSVAAAVARGGLVRHYLGICERAVEARHSLVFSYPAAEVPLPDLTPEEAWKAVAAVEDPMRALLFGNLARGPDAFDWALVERLTQAAVEHLDGHSALPLCVRALDVARVRGHAVAEAYLSFRIGRQYVLQSEADLADRYLQAAVAGARELEDRTLEALALTAIGLSQHRSGELAVADEALTAALGLTDPADHERLTLVLTNLATLRQTQGRTAEARTLFTRVVDLEPEGQLSDSGVFVYLNLIVEASDDGDVQAATRLLHRLLSFKLSPNAQYHGPLLVTRAEVARLTGDLRAASKLAREAIEVGRKTDDNFLSVHAHRTAGRTASAELDAISALNLLETALGLTLDHQLRLDEAVVRHDLGEVLEADADPVAALEQYRAALAIAEELGMPQRQRYAEAVRRLSED